MVPQIGGLFIEHCSCKQHIIFTSVEENKKKTLKLFIEEVCITLLEGFSRRTAHSGRPIQGNIPQRLTEQHWLDKADSRK